MKAFRSFLQFMRSLGNFLVLTAHGFSITHADHGSLSGLEIYRFMWNGKVITNAMDIDRVDGYVFSSVNSGGSVRLSFERPTKSYILSMWWPLKSLLGIPFNKIDVQHARMINDYLLNKFTSRLNKFELMSDIRYTSAPDWIHMIAGTTEVFSVLSDKGNPVTLPEVWDSFVVSTIFSYVNKRSRRHDRR